MNKGKRKFSASRAAFSCNMFRGKKVAIVLSEIYLHPCDLYRTNTTYFDSSLRHALNSWWQQLLGKTYGLRFQNRAMFIHNFVYSTAQKMNFSIKDFFSKRDQICRRLRIWSHLLEKSLIEKFIFRAL